MSEYLLAKPEPFIRITDTIRLKYGNSNTYTVKEIGNAVCNYFQHNSIYETKNNVIPTSINEDGSIFNDVGYMQGYRLNSSGGLTEIGGKSCVTGFFPCKNKDIIQLAGLDWIQTFDYAYFHAYDDNFNYLGGFNYRSDFPSTISFKYGIFENSPSLVTYDNSGITTIIPQTADNSSFSYARISAFGDGKGAVIAVNNTVL